MKLLLDENLSRRILPFLQDTFPGSSHVMFEGLEQAVDDAVWRHAKDNHFVIVTKDSDFYDFSLVRGAPPKIVWLRAGNTGKAGIIRLLNENRGKISDLLADNNVACVEIG